MFLLAEPASALADAGSVFVDFRASFKITSFVGSVSCHIYNLHILLLYSFI